MAELKTKKNAASSTAFIDSVKDAQRRADGKQLLKIFKEATGMKPVMWGETGVGTRRKGAGASAPSRDRAKSQQRFTSGRAIVGFGQYHYKSERSSQEGDWPLTGFSPRVQSLTIYIMPGFKAYGALLKKLGKHKISGGSCIYINKLEDVDLSVLKQIIKQSFLEMKKKYSA